MSQGVRSVLEVPAVGAAIEGSADPDGVRLALTRVLEAQPQAAEALADDERFRAALVAVLAASRSLTRGIETDGSMLDVLGDQRALAGERDEADLLDGVRAAMSDVAGDTSDISDTSDTQAARRALRRWKRRELLRIAVRDLLGLADMPTVGRELAALATACLQAALEVAAPSVPMSVVGMGKLGGGELNYSSDVDVLFVHHDGSTGDFQEAERAAREMLAIMAEPGPDGIVFRTDANLRPEGRSGPLSRTVESYEAYYERWADAWEFQALLKARPVAGDRDLGGAFAALAERAVWTFELDTDAVREIRSMKERAETLLRQQDLAEREIKRGWGGIRDVEFAVQLLQLVHGRHAEEIRTPTTLDALARLAEHGFVDPGEAGALDEAYRFLRTVEHRLQLVDEQQVHAIPSGEQPQRLLARVLGYRDEAGASAWERFRGDLGRHQAVVRAIHERLFFRPLLEAFAGAGPLGPEAVEERLAAFGFRDADQIRGALAELTSGLSRQSRLMEQLFPLILDWLSESPDPDLGLLQLRTLAEGPARSASLAQAFRDSAVTAERTCRLLGSSRVVGQSLRRHPEAVAWLADGDDLERPRTRDDYAEQARQTLAWRGDTEAHRDGIRRFKRREVLRIAARDLLGLADVQTVGRELAGLADATIEATLRAVEPRVPLAVIGLGRLGGRSLSYASDLDVIFVFDGESPADFEEAERAAHALIREVSARSTEGELYDIDARLRPEGGGGAMARSLEGYRQYYERWAQTWEFQALIKARLVAGNPIVGHRFLAQADPYVYRTPFPDSAVREIRQMKARMEAERIPSGEDPTFHLKLGPGSLSDVEFTSQLLKLRYGGERPELRGTETVGSLERMAAAGLLDAEDAERLIDAYRFCERARNYRFLHVGRDTGSLPQDHADGAHLARMLGYTARPLTSMREDYRRLTRRCRRVVERVFYGKT